MKTSYYLAAAVLAAAGAAVFAQLPPARVPRVCPKLSDGHW